MPPSGHWRLLNGPTVAENDSLTTAAAPTVDHDVRSVGSLRTCTDRFDDVPVYVPVTMRSVCVVGVVNSWPIVGLVMKPTAGAGGGGGAGAASGPAPLGGGGVGGSDCFCAGAPQAPRAT